MRHLLTSAALSCTLALGVAACSKDQPVDTVDAAVDAAGAVDAATTAKVTVSFRFGGSPDESCGEAGTQYVDVDLIAADDPQRIIRFENKPCDQAAPLVVPDVPAGTYTVTVVSWAAQLWHGQVDGIVHSVTSPAAVTVDLVLMPAPPGP